LGIGNWALGIDCNPQATRHKPQATSYNPQSTRYNPVVATFAVRMFAYLKDRHGDAVVVSADPHVEGVLSALQEQGIDTKSCRLSVNFAFSLGDEALNEGDELALIPPVSGG
jgi:molybdopterin converting factor small subunit